MRQTTITTKLTANKKWYVVDAEGQILGRLAAQVATVLRGKNKPDFTPNADMG
ncbi:50S ribosomal protein L13, partial [Mycoplasmopsis pullorum]